MPRGHWDAEDDDEEEVEGADENEIGRAHV